MGSRRRKEPVRDGGHDRERERERDRGKEYERDGRDGRGGRGYHRREDYDHGGPGPVHRSSRDYGRERDRDREPDRERDNKGFERDREREYGGKKDEPPRRRERGRERKSSGAKEWEDVKREPRRQSRSSPPREREKRDMYDDRGSDDRVEKVFANFLFGGHVLISFSGRGTMHRRRTTATRCRWMRNRRRPLNQSQRAGGQRLLRREKSKADCILFPCL